LGYTSLILSLLSACMCWIPYGGWGGMFLGLVGAALGIAVITRSQPNPGFDLLGGTALVLAAIGTTFGLAYQLKYAGGSLDILYFPLVRPTAWYVVGGLAALVPAGLLLGRRLALPGRTLAAAAFLALSLAGGWAISTAEREMSASGVEQAAMIGEAQTSNDAPR